MQIYGHTLCGDHVREADLHGLALQTREHRELIQILKNYRTLSLKALFAPETAGAGATGTEGADMTIGGLDAGLECALRLSAFENAI